MANAFGLSGKSKQALLDTLRQRRTNAVAELPPSAMRLPSPGDRGRYAEIRAMRAVRDTLDLPDMFFGAHDGMSGPLTQIMGREFINFMSYDYCGLNRDARVQAAAVAAIERHGISVGASRINAGARPVHAELESALARHYEAEDAITLVSGHATNVTVVGCLFGDGDLLLHDSLAHNSMIQGAVLSGARRLSFPHNDLTALNRLLSQARPQAGQAAILVEGHYSMDGDVPDLAGLVALARRHEAYLMVDEAHSLGVLGATGRGVSEHCGVAMNEVDIWMGTLSKTLAGCGGYIAGSAAMVDYLRNTASGSVYSVGMPSPVAAASLAALEILHAEPDRARRVQENGALFLSEARAAGLDTGASVGSAIVPVIIGSALATARAAAWLRERGIFVIPVLPPGVPDSSSRLRFFVTEGHTAEQIRLTVRLTAEAVETARRERLPLALKARLAEMMRP